MTHTAIMAALYVVLSMMINIPIVNRIVLEVGYVVLGVCSSYMDYYQLMFIGGSGCVLKALLTGGNFPIGWFPAQLLLGYLLSYLKKSNSLGLKIILGIIMTFFCICLVKTLIEVPVFHLPFWAKIASNSAAALSDSAGLVIGILLSSRIKKMIH